MSNPFKDAWDWTKDKVGGAIGLTDAEGTGDIEDAVGAAKKKRDALDAELANFQNRQAPQQAAAPQAQTGTPVTAKTSNAAELGNAAARMPVNPAERVNIGPAATTARTQVAPAPAVATVGMGPAALAGPVRIATVPQEQVRSQTLNLASQLEAAAGGAGPSVAEALRQKQHDENIRAQLALVAGSRGAQGAAALRQAGHNIADQGQKLGNDMAALRAQEIAKSRELLAGVLGQTRAQDVGLATEQARVTQTGALADAQASNQQNQFFASEEGKRRALEATLQADSNKLQAQIDAAKATGDAAAVQDLTKLKAQLDSEIEKTRFTTEAQLSSNDAARQDTVRMADADRRQRSDALNAQLGIDADKFNSQQFAEISKFNSQLAAAKNERDLNAVLAVMALDDRAKEDLRTAWLAANQQVMGGAGSLMAEDVRSDAAFADFGVRVGQAMAGMPPTGTGGMGAGGAK